MAPQEDAYQISNELYHYDDSAVGQGVLVNNLLITSSRNDPVDNSIKFQIDSGIHDQRLSGRNSGTMMELDFCTHPVDGKGT